ncbi:MAG: aldo/keto reductase [Dehalococcoidia bacterium]
MRYADMGGRDVSVIGVGIWQFGSKAWGWGKEFGSDEAGRIVQRALDLGVNLFDTAEIYSGGTSETLLGAALAGRRDDAFIASKVWPLHALPRQVRSAASRSLGRLQTDHMDLYQVHWPNPVVPLAWTMAGMRDVLDAGATKAVGVSNFGLARWLRAEEALGSVVIANQVPYNILQRGVERELLPYAQSNGRVIIAYSPLAQGALSGRYGVDNLPGGFRRANALFLPENISRARPVVDALREVGAAHSATPAQIALAWLVRQPNVVAIPGAKSVAQLEENAAAADIELTPDEIARLEQVSAAFHPVSRMRNVRQLVRRLVSR